MDTLVFVHGYLGGSPQWAPQVAEFSKRFRVITPDLPGFGLNRAMTAPESIDGFARFVLDDLERQGVDRFHLVGHSMGGMIVQQMVALAPDRVDRLVLYGTGPIGLMPGRFEPIDESRRKLNEDGVERTACRIAATWFLHGEDGSGYSTCAELAIRASLQAALAGLKAMESWSGVANLSSVASPTLVLWGDGDRAYQWSQVEQLWRQIADAGLAVVPGCSHAVHLEKTALFNALLMDFLVPQSPGH